MKVCCVKVFNNSYRGESELRGQIKKNKEVNFLWSVLKTFAAPDKNLYDVTSVVKAE